MMLTESEKNSSEYIINESLKFSEKGLKKQNLSILFYTSCQDIVNSCTINGSIHSSYNCCQRISMNIGTLNGICFTFNSNTLQKNINLTNNGNIGIIFQISRNSFAFNGINTHPGLSIYLADENDNDNKFQLHNSQFYHLTDKKGLRLLLKKKESVDQLRYRCGFTPLSAEDIDKTWKSPFECLLEAGIKECGCHPLISEYLIKDNCSLYKVIKNTSICFANQLQDCFYPYLYYSYNQNFYKIQNFGATLEENSISKCLKKYPPPCYSSSYTSQKQYYHLTADYNSTKDFIAEFQISFESLIVQREIYSNNYGIFNLLSSLAFNFAFWFLLPIWIFFSIHLCSMKGDKTYTTIEIIERSKVKPTKNIADISLTNIEKNKTINENVNSIIDNYNIFVPKKRPVNSTDLEESLKKF